MTMFLLLIIVFSCSISFLNALETDNKMNRNHKFNSNGPNKKPLYTESVNKLLHTLNKEKFDLYFNYEECTIAKSFLETNIKRNNQLLKDAKTKILSQNDQLTQAAANNVQLTSQIAGLLGCTVDIERFKECMNKLSIYTLPGKIKLVNNQMYVLYDYSNFMTGTTFLGATGVCGTIPGGSVIKANDPNLALVKLAIKAAYPSSFRFVTEMPLRGDTATDCIETTLDSAATRGCTADFLYLPVACTIPDGSCTFN